MLDLDLEHQISHRGRHLLGRIGSHPTASKVKLELRAGFRLSSFQGPATQKRN